MDIYYISPLKHVNMMCYGDRLFCLAQFVNNKYTYYIEFFNECKRQGNTFITIDNGLAENQQVSTQQLVEKANQVQADEIICPDKLYDYEGTVKMTNNFIDNLSEKELTKYELMAVPHGKTKSEYMKCFKDLQDIIDIKTLGISKFDCVKLWSKDNDKDPIGDSRKRLFIDLQLYNLLENPLHLLGRGNSFELSFFHNNPFVRSSDSCIEILCALHGIVLDDKLGLVKPRPVSSNGYFHCGLDNKQYIHAIHNMKTAKEFAR